VSSVTRNEVVAAAAVKYLRDLIVNYKGSPDKLGAYSARARPEYHFTLLSEVTHNRILSEVLLWVRL